MDQKLIYPFYDAAKKKNDVVRCRRSKNFLISKIGLASLRSVSLALILKRGKSDRSRGHRTNKAECALRETEERRRATGKCVRSVKVILVAPSSPLLDRSYRFVELDRYRYLKTRSRPTVVLVVLGCTDRLSEEKTKQRRSNDEKEESFV